MSRAARHEDRSTTLAVVFAAHTLVATCICLVIFNLGGRFDNDGEDFSVVVLEFPNFIALPVPLLRQVPVEALKHCK